MCQHQSQKSLIICFLIGIFLKVYGADVGVAFAPMVRKGDLPNDRSYTKEMVKVMLEIILKADYRSVTTWGVGAPNKPFDKSAISESASIVHTAIAAAEINKERKYLALTIYEGLYQSVYEDQVNTEIEIGIQMAKEANEIFPGTVPALIFLSRVGFNELIDNTNLNIKFKNVSAKVRGLNLKFGVRITDCPQIPTRSYQKVMDVVSQTDFIICMVAPDENRFKFGYENFKNSAILSLLQAEEFLEKTVKMNMSSIKLILETGWAGDDTLKPPNSVSDLTGFWELITEWAKQSDRQVFLHEAFDSPWKDTISEGAELAAHFGRWKYNESEKNPLNINAYILKEDAVPSPIARLLAGFSWTQGGILVGIVLLIAITTFMTLLYKRVNRIEFTVLSEIDVKAFFDGVTDDGEYVDAIWEKSPYDKSLELAKSQLKIDTTGKGLLGSGQFGFVYKGKMQSSETEVAVKMTRPYSPPIAVKCLLSEIKILTYVGSHNHVCKLLGAFTQEISNGVVYFAMELCHSGSLERYLQKNKSNFQPDSNRVIEEPKDAPTDLEKKPLTESQLIRWAYEIASAMVYISSKNVIHADLAARNILLTADLTAKVTDFGLSRRLLEENPYYSKSGTEPLPWKWMAPESLAPEQRKFSTKSDVWAYGVVLYEVFSLGATPNYPNIHSWTDLLPYLKTGGRLKKPEFATSEVYEIMERCWILEYRNRASFKEILDLLIAMIDLDYRDL